MVLRPNSNLFNNISQHSVYHKLREMLRWISLCLFAVILKFGFQICKFSYPIFVVLLVCGILVESSFGFELYFNVNFGCTWIKDYKMGYPL